MSHSEPRSRPSASSASSARSGSSARSMQDPSPRRLVILTEGQFGPHHGKTAMGVIRYGTDPICAVLDSSIAGRNVSEWLPGKNIPAVPTGQTGMMIDGWGVAVDRVISDFLQGTVEWLVEQAEDRGDWIIVEGQGSLDHPAYSSVTLGLIHGSTPQAMVMVHKPGLAAHDFDHLPEASFPIAKLPEFIRGHEAVAGMV